MSCNPALIRRDLIHFGIKKRAAGHILGLGTVALRLANGLRANSESKHVVILEPFGLGDIISFEPLVRALKANGYAVTMCGKKEWKSLYPEDQQLKWLDANLPWSAHDENKKYFLKDYASGGFRSWLQRVRVSGKGAIGLDTRGDIRSVAVLRAAGCRRVLALENYLGSDLRITAGTAELVAFDHTMRRWELNLQFLKALAPGLKLSGTNGPHFEHLAQKQNPVTKRVGLMPVAPWAGKWWAAEKWKELTTTLQARNMGVVGLCGPGQVDLARQQLQVPLQLKECKSVEGWAAALNECSVVVTLDSGPMHLADAIGIPTVALFGQGKLPLWAPSNPRSCTISHQNDPDFVLCQPVAENTARAQEFMSRITVAEVLDAI
jgi:ADP-heptose:LPS heptosyltransferase